MSVKEEMSAVQMRGLVESLNKQIADKISTQVSSEDLDGLAGHLSELANLLPSSAKAVATSELIYNIKIGELMGNAQFSGLSATDRKLIFQGKAAKEIALMTYTERLNKSLVHCMDARRTVISLAKAELENLKNM